MKYFVSGIGTDVGKTVVSAILCRALNAFYWKPVQAGSLDYTDSDRVEELSGITPGRILPELFRLSEPLSPHAAAKIDNIEISLESFQLPDTENEALVVEGAGGLMVPLNDNETVLDLIARFDIPVILTSMHYLGSINHSLLSLSALHERGIEVAGVVFIGESNPETETVISSHMQEGFICRIPFAEKLDAEYVKDEALRIQGMLFS